MTRLALLACAVATLSGCGSLLESTIPAPQAYVLRLPARTAPVATTPPAGTVRVQRPAAGPGLDSDRIALLRSDQRFDFFAATRWAGPAPDLMADAMVDQLRGSGLFTAVFDDASPYLPNYSLRCGLRRFEADYRAGGGPPTVEVALDCTFGRPRERALLATFTARGSARASEDRLGAVVAAFEAATVAALSELERQVIGALASDGINTP